MCAWSVSSGGQVPACAHSLSCFCFMPIPERRSCWGGPRAAEMHIMKRLVSSVLLDAHKISIQVATWEKAASLKLPSWPNANREKFSHTFSIYSAPYILSPATSLTRSGLCTRGRLVTLRYSGYSYDFFAIVDSKKMFFWIHVCFRSHTNIVNTTPPPPVISFQKHNFLSLRAINRSRWWYLPPQQ